jgi:hypothetical protein
MIDVEQMLLGPHTIIKYVEATYIRLCFCRNTTDSSLLGPIPSADMLRQRTSDYVYVVTQPTLVYMARYHQQTC